MSPHAKHTPKHSPGPFAVHRSNMVTIEDANGESVATPNWPLRRDFTQEEFDANCNLFASAPALFEALKAQEKASEAYEAYLSVSDNPRHEQFKEQRWTAFRVLQIEADDLREAALSSAQPEAPTE